MLRAYANGLLFGENYGVGRPVVIWLHGWGRSSVDFRAAATILADQGIPSLSFDLPGFGASPLPRDVGGAQAYATTVVSALAECGSGPFVLVGHSFGGRVAAALAAEHPELVSAVVFTGVPLVRRTSRRRAPLGYRVVRWLGAKHLISAQRLEAAKKKYGSADYRAASGVLRDILVTVVNESYESELAVISAPVTMVWGADDRDVPVSVAERAATLLQRRPETIIVENCGHLVPTSAPAALAAAVVARCA